MISLQRMYGNTKTGKLSFLTVAPSCTYDFGHLRGVFEDQFRPEVFMQALICSQNTIPDAGKLLMLDAPQMASSQAFMSSLRPITIPMPKVSDGTEGFGASPYPYLDEFVAHGVLPGRIRK